MDFLCGGFARTPTCLYVIVFGSLSGPAIIASLLEEDLCGGLIASLLEEDLCGGLIASLLLKEGQRGGLLLSYANPSF